MSGSHWGRTPQESVAAECSRRGPAAVVSGCVALLQGAPADADPALLLALSGPGGRKFLDGQPHDDVYWLRVWGARGLLWALPELPDGDALLGQAVAAVVAALSDDAWRVREMAAKVVARHRLGEALDAVAALRDDPVPRVATAAGRAVTLLTAAGA